MRLWTFSAREFGRRRGRMLLTLAGIALGIAAVVATRLTIHSVRAAYADLYGTTGRAQLEVSALGGGGFDEALADTCSSVPGVGAVVPRVVGVVALLGPKGRMPVLIQGKSVEGTAAGDTWICCQGHWPSGGGEALLDSGMADRLGLHPGNRVLLWAPSGAAELSLVGLLRPARPRAMGGNLIVTFETARNLLGLGAQINNLEISLDRGADPDAVRRALERRLPPGLVVAEVGHGDQLARGTLAPTEQGLSALGTVALVAAAFVLLNTALLSLHERRRDLALLRALGTGRWQLWWLLTREAVVLAVPGTLAGLGLGLMMAWGLVAAMREFLDAPLGGLILTPEPFLLGSVLGPGLTLGTAAVPVWWTGRHSPLGDLLMKRPVANRTSGLPTWLDCALLGVGLCLAFGICRGWFPPTAAAGMFPSVLVILLAGSALSVPLVTTPLLWLAGKAPLGLEFRLAAGQLLQRPGAPTSFWECSSCPWWWPWALATRLEPRCAT